MFSKCDFRTNKKKISAQNYNSLRGMLDKKNDDAQGEKVLSALEQRPKEKKIFTKKKTTTKNKTLLVLFYKYVNSNIQTN